MSSEPLQFFSVVGVGRSGTSLLMAMLDSHPDLSVPPETQFLTRHVTRWPRATLEQTTARLRDEVNYARLGIPLEEMLEPYTSRGEAFSNASLYRRLFSYWATRSGCARVGDKSPKNVEHLPLLHWLWPGARIVHIVRDPRDVYLSRKKAEWSRDRAATLNVLAYRAQRERGRVLGPRCFGDRYLEVAYEDLVQDTERTLRGLCEFLQVPFAAQMLDHREAAKGRVFAEEAAWKREVLGPVLRDNTEKWRRELAPREIQLVEDFCHPSFRRDRYREAMPLGGMAPRRRATRLAATVGAWLYRARLAALDRRAIGAAHSRHGGPPPLIA